MNWADYAIAAVIAISVLVGLFRGLVAEVLSLAIWIGSIWVAWAFGPDVAAYFDHSIHTPQLRLVAGYGICVVGVLIVGALVNAIFHRLVTRAGLTGPDRALGVLFGFARGVLLVALMVFLLGFTAVVREPWWRQSLLLPQFQGVAIAVGHYLPASTGRYLHPSPDVLDGLPKLPGAVQTANLSSMRQLLDAQAATLRGAGPAPTSSAPAASSRATVPPAAAPTHP
ncbi:MAG: colicin V production protein [Lysobacterales bacterium 14-68-21]|jgi:membrane protein required for colicin V production|nr:MAG: colicin V production protein [Xanthomonadales bacterium 15-68-25]OZB64697.1 MAG: colicin V production protein [Xanthomonadales bacterium 14-68-21]